MAEAGLSQNVYLLDGSDLGRWSEDVQAVAERATDAFIAGEVCPAPKDVSPVAQRILTKAEADIASLEDSTRLQTHVCDV